MAKEAVVHNSTAASSSWKTKKAPGHKSRGSFFLVIPATRTRKGEIELATFLSGKHVRQSYSLGDPGQNRTGDLPLRSSRNHKSLYIFLHITAKVGSVKLVPIRLFPIFTILCFYLFISICTLLHLLLQNKVRIRCRHALKIVSNSPT